MRDVHTDQSVALAVAVTVTRGLRRLFQLYIGGFWRKIRYLTDYRVVFKLSNIYTSSVRYALRAPGYVITLNRSGTVDEGSINDQLLTCDILCVVAHQE